MVDSVPRWRLSLSRPIQSDHLSIADYDDTAFGAGNLPWQDPVHSWRAGPGEVMTSENLFNDLADMSRDKIAILTRFYGVRGTPVGQ